MRECFYINYGERRRGQEGDFPPGSANFDHFLTLNLRIMYSTSVHSSARDKLKSSGIESSFSNSLLNCAGKCYCVNVSVITCNLQISGKNASMPA
jgi:hypothetical protein